MANSDKTPDMNELAYPGGWDKETLREKWIQYLQTMIEESKGSIPLKRLRYQVEQSTVYQETERRWDTMNPDERLKAWKSLLESSDQMAKDVLPTCVQCGECCRKGSPTLHLDDLEILKQGEIPWEQLFTLRRGEPVRSPFADGLVFLLDERIKIRELEGKQECVFFKADSDECGIYANRPLQCRAQACWDPEPSKELDKQAYLTRRDIFKGVELLLEMIAEHDRRFSFDKLREAFQRLEDSRGETVNELLELMAYEDHFRTFLSEKFNIPQNNLELVFGRSFADMAHMFGFRVLTEPDGSRCLVIDRDE